MSHIRLIVVIGLLIFLPAAGKSAPPDPSKTDKCPVCGMFVAKYPDFLARIVFKDGSAAFFDGAKDMFKYYFAIDRYNPAKNTGEIASILVTDYYSMAPVDGRAACYVLGSDVFGPMGRELIPFALEADAREFMQDHAGKELLPFGAITPELVKGLD